MDANGLLTSARSGPPSPLRTPAFRDLWLAGLVSDAGDWMLLIALPIVVYRLTGSALGTSVAFLAELAPGVVLGPLAGRLADRLDRRRVMLGVTALQGTALLPLLLVGGRSGLALVYAVIVAQASLAALFDPAKNALLPDLVAPGQLVAGNSLIALGQGIGRLAGGPLGGLLLAAGSLHTIVIADAVSFLVAAGLIARVRRATLGSAARVHRGPEPRPPGPSYRVGRALRASGLRSGLLVAFVAEIAQGIFVVLFIVFVARRLHGGPGEIGTLRGVQAVGAILAGLALATRLGVAAPGRLVAVAALAFGALDLTIWNAPALSTASGVFAGLFILAGAPGVAMQTGLITVLQQAAPATLRGAAFGVFGTVSSAGQAIGMLAAGALTAPLGLTALLNAQGLLYVLAGVLAARGLSERYRYGHRVAAA